MCLGEICVLTHNFTAWQRASDWTCARTPIAYERNYEFRLASFRCARFHATRRTSRAGPMGFRNFEFTILELNGENKWRADEQMHHAMRRYQANRWPYKMYLILSNHANYNRNKFHFGRDRGDARHIQIDCVWRKLWRAARTVFLSRFVYPVCLGNSVGNSSAAAAANWLFALVGPNGLIALKCFDTY